MAHLNLDVVILDVEIGEELLHVVIRGVTRDTSKLDVQVHVVFIEDVVNPDCLATELVLHEAHELLVAHWVQPGGAAAKLLPAELISCLLGDVFTLHEDASMAGSSAAFKLTNADRVLDERKVLKELLDLLSFDPPWQVAQLDSCPHFRGD